MNVNVNVRSSEDLDAPELVEDLYDWLREEPSLRPAVAAVRRPPRQGEMNGGVVDLLTVSLGSGGAVAVLAGVLNAWITRMRNARVSINIEQTNDGGRSATFTAENCSVEEIKSLLEYLSRESGANGTS